MAAQGQQLAGLFRQGFRQSRSYPGSLPQRGMEWQHGLGLRGRACRGAEPAAITPPQAPPAQQNANCLTRGGTAPRVGAPCTLRAPAQGAQNLQIWRRQGGALSRLSEGLPCAALLPLRAAEAAAVERRATPHRFQHQAILRARRQRSATKRVLACTRAHPFTFPPDCASQWYAR